MPQVAELFTRGPWAIALLLVGLLFPANASALELQKSSKPDRTNPTVLAGSTVSGNAYIFATGAASSPVRFFLDEEPDSTPYRTENYAPFDFNGGSVTTANPYDTTQLADGQHRITATARKQRVSVTFTIANQVTPSPPAPSAPSLPSGTLYGFHQGLGYFGDISFWGPRLEVTASIGSRVTRGTMLWDVVEPSNDGFSWTRSDALVAAIKAKGMVPVFDLGGSPSWANGSSDRWVVPSGATAFDTWVSEYAEFAGRVAARYAGQGLLYEIWNEPNEVYFWKGSPPSIDRYAQLFTAARAAILAADPAAKVGLGGITGLGASCCIQGLQFISGLIDRGVQFDYAGIHPYISQMDRGPDTHVDGEQNFDDVLAVHNLLESRGRTNVKLWLTEWGWYNCYPDDATKATWLRRGHERIRDEWSSFVSVSAFFFDIDTPSYPCGGVFRSDFTRKPAATAFSNFMETLGSTAAAP
jgi:Glycosyl hydrolases family 39